MIIWNRSRFCLPLRKNVWNYWFSVMRIKIEKLRRSLQILTLILLLTAAGNAQITQSKKQKIFDKVWDNINRKYYDPNFNDVNWNAVREIYRPRVESAKSDDEFYAIIKRMVGELGDAHTTFQTAQDVQLRKQKSSVGVGLWLGDAEGKTAVFGVAADTEAARAGIQPGMILTAVGGRDVREILAEKRAEIKSSSANAVNRIAYAKLLGGAENSSINLSLLDLNDHPQEITLTRRSAKTPDFSVPGLVTRRLASSIGYIRFDVFDSSFLKQYKKALIELKDTKGLIIDLRFNRGGEFYAMEEMAERLISEKVSFGRLKTRTGKIPKFLGISLMPKELFVGDDDMHEYSAPIVVLMSRYSASAAEYFALGMQESNRAKIVGEQSCGCMLGIMGKTRIEGGELYLREIDFISAQGKRIEGVGVAPDPALAPTVNDLRSGFTAAIEKAEELLGGNTN
jgi:carboxyl-terminal processing protease